MRVSWREDFNQDLNVCRGCNFRSYQETLLGAGAVILAFNISFIRYKCGYSCHGRKAQWVSELKLGR